MNKSQISSYNLTQKTRSNRETFQVIQSILVTWEDSRHEKAVARSVCACACVHVGFLFKFPWCPVPCVKEVCDWGCERAEQKLQEGGGHVHLPVWPNHLQLYTKVPFWLVIQWGFFLQSNNGDHRSLEVGKCDCYKPPSLALPSISFSHLPGLLQLIPK